MQRIKQGAENNYGKNITHTTPGAVTRGALPALHQQNLPQLPRRTVSHAEGHSTVFISTKEEVQEELESHGEDYKERIMADKSKWGKNTTEYGEEARYAGTLGLTAVEYYRTPEYGRVAAEPGAVDDVLDSTQAAVLPASDNITHSTDGSTVISEVRAAISGVAASLNVNDRTAVQLVMDSTAYHDLAGSHRYNKVDQIMLRYFGSATSTSARQSTITKAKYLLQAAVAFANAVKAEVGKLLPLNSTYFIILCVQNNCLYHTRYFRCLCDHYIWRERFAGRAKGEKRR